ncbi:MAG: oligosaccharide flippase family protein [Candidatus Thorarchaeota archaeon]
MSTGRIVKSGLWIYIGGLSTNIIGYVYWILASRFVPPDIVGIASAIIALQGLLVVVVSLGLPTGMKRFIGKTMDDEDYSRMSGYFSTNLLIMTTLSFSAVIVLTLFANLYQGALGISSSDILFVVLLTLLNVFTPLLMSLFDSLLRTRITAISQILSAIAKITIGLFLFVMGLGFIAIMTTFAISSLLADMVLSYAAYSFFKRQKVSLKPEKEFWKESVIAGLPAWIPNILTISGQSFAILSTYALIGQTETGLYYLAYAIAAVVYAIPTSILGLMYPVMSGMSSGRKTAITRMTKIAVAITAPISISVTLYSAIPLMMLGPQYAGSAPLLSILVIGAPFYAIYAGYYGYVYAIKRYYHVVSLGLAINGSRLVFYFLLAGMFGVMGVAWGYFLGIVLGLMGMACSSYIISYRPAWVLYMKAILTPSAFAIGCILFDIQWFIGIPLILVISFIIYTKFGVILKADGVEILEVFTSEDTRQRFHPYLKWISGILFGD